MLPSAPRRRRFKGTIKQGGKPVADANVIFYPQGEGGRVATGTTDAQGAFTLTTYETGDGAVVGSHKVTVTAGTAVPESNDPAALEQAAKDQQTLPEKFATVDKTTITAEVEAKGSTFEWDLDSL